MKEYLDGIIATINTNKDWSKNKKIRYAYVELGKVVHKDYLFFYTIQNNLLNSKEELRYSFDEVSKMINDENHFDYKVVCRTAAEMLKYIFDNTGIESEVRRTIDSEYYKTPEGQIEIRHYFLVVTGDDYKKYFLTLNPDLPNIQLGFRTSHFGNKIDYYINKTFTDDDGKEYTKSVQNYEGDEVECSVFSLQDLFELDKELGYNLSLLYEETEPKYTDVFFQMLKKAFHNNELYYEIISRKTPFYYDICSLINGRETIEDIIASNNKRDYNDVLDTSIDRNIFSLKPLEWKRVKQFTMAAVISRYSSKYDLGISLDMYEEYTRALYYKDYDAMAQTFKNIFVSKVGTNKVTKKLGKFNPLNRIDIVKKLFLLIDEISAASIIEDKLLKKQEFFTLFQELLLIFVDDIYLPIDRTHLSSTYISSKIICSFYQIFDIGTPFELNEISLGEQITVIKEVLKIVLDDIKPDPKYIPNYDAKKSPIKNRLLTTVIFDKKNPENAYYLMIVKNTKQEIPEFDYNVPILYDLRNNLLLTDISIIDIYSNYYIIKDADLKLMIEQMTQQGDAFSN